MEVGETASEEAHVARHSISQTRSGSCVVCTKAKSKCTRRPGCSVCERCSRLQKDCQIREPTKRKRSKAKSTRTAQLKNLETKLADIAEALTARQSQDAPTGISPVASTPVPVLLHQDPTAGHHLNPPSPPSTTTPSTIELGSLIGSVHSRSDMQSIHRNEGADTSPRDTETLFNRYQRLMAPYMPFVVIPTGTHVSILAKTRPFLLQAITAVTFFHDTTMQQRMAKYLIRQFSERVLINCEKSLDILQSLLVFLNWYNPHLFTPPNHTVLLHLAMALTHDLDIDRVPGTCEKVALMAATKAHGVPQPVKRISSDERRAVVGTFYLTSQIFTSFRKVEMNWTPWLTACVDELARAQEYGSDTVLVQLAQSQRIMQEVMNTQYEHAPVQFYAKSFLSDLENLGPAAGAGSVATVSRLQHAVTRTAIWERSFVDLTTKSAKETDLRSRLDGMWRCMEAAKGFTSIYLGLPVEDYLVVPFGIFAQFAYIFTALTRASSIEQNGWDVHCLREFIDFSTLMEEASQRYDAVSQVCIDGLALSNEAFAKWSAKTKWAKSFYDTKFLTAASSPTCATQSRTVNGITRDMEANQESCHIRPTQDSGSRMPFPTSLEASMDPSLGSFRAFDDLFGTSFDGPLRFTDDLDLRFEDF